MQVMKNWEPLVSGPEGKREQNFKSFQETWLIKDKYRYFFLYCLSTVKQIYNKVPGMDDFASL